MKKVFVVACLSVFVLASCKKERNCECKDNGSSSADVFPLKKASKKDAKKACDDIKSGLAYDSCELK